MHAWNSRRKIAFGSLPISETSSPELELDEQLIGLLQPNPDGFPSLCAEPRLAVKVRARSFEIDSIPIRSDPIK
jgi:hypothetical protein